MARARQEAVRRHAYRGPPTRSDANGRTTDPVAPPCGNAPGRSDAVRLRSIAASRPWSWKVASACSIGGGSDCSTPPSSLRRAARASSAEGRSTRTTMPRRSNGSEALELAGTSQRSMNARRVARGRFRALAATLPWRRTTGKGAREPRSSALNEATTSPQQRRCAGGLPGQESEAWRIWRWLLRRHRFVDGRRSERCAAESQRSDPRHRGQAWC